MAKILEKRRLTPITQLYKVDAPLVAKAAKPGQFVIIRVREGGERIPLTIADYDRESGVLTIVVQEVGTTTRYMGQLEVGDDILLGGSHRGRGQRKQGGCDEGGCFHGFG